LYTVSKTANLEKQQTLDELYILLQKERCSKGSGVLFVKRLFNAFNNYICSQKLKAQGERQKAEAGRIVKVRNQPSEIRNSILWVAYLK
jgi:hypothetical protein